MGGTHSRSQDRGERTPQRILMDQPSRNRSVIRKEKHWVENIDRYIRGFGFRGNMNETNHRQNMKEDRERLLQLVMYCVCSMVSYVFIVMSTNCFFYIKQSLGAALKNRIIHSKPILKSFDPFNLDIERIPLSANWYETTRM